MLYSKIFTREEFENTLDVLNGLSYFSKDIDEQYRIDSALESVRLAYQVYELEIIEDK